MNDKFKSLILWFIIVMVLISVFSNLSQHRLEANRMSYSAFLNSVNQGEVAQVTVTDRTIHGVSRAGKPFTTFMPMQDQFLLGELIKKGVNVQGHAPEQQSMLLHIFINWFPMLLLIGVWVFFMRQMQGGGGKGNPMSFGRSRAKLSTGNQIKIKFNDVAGAEEAKEEVSELVEFLRDPDKFQRLGGKIPCGVLLVGSPGTGKTLIAKAVAGEADVPFFSISGSDFVEMFVGVGASRVRDMFEQAKKQAPCIIFIDEIDAVGRHRGAGLGGGHDEREQTLNQLLVEMDGFEGKEGVIVMAATNRPDVLDPALLRPGRFDRQVMIPLPDLRGREQILQVHLRKVAVNSAINVKAIARGTPGFSGADLANLVNEAALFAARGNKQAVDMDEMERAKDKIMMGAERRSMVMNEEERRLTAYHEAGHTIVGLSVPDHDPVYKVSIIPRGRALGVTMFLPEQDRYSQTKEALKSQICSLYGGRIAEEMIFGDEKVTTGASNDIERATDLARNFVTRWGLSKELGPIAYGKNAEEVFLGHSVTQSQHISASTAQRIDEEITRIINECYQRAEKILKKHVDVLHLMAEALLKFETIDKDQIDDAMAGNVPRTPEDWDKTIEIEPVSVESLQAEKAPKKIIKRRKKPALKAVKKDDLENNTSD